MISFSSEINLEFCFNCFENTLQGRGAVQNAIKEARYHGQGTNTGATTKCVCDELLNSRCGVNSMPACLDIVYITDGKSNDHRLQVCEEVKCLHRQYGINTYAIGINSSPLYGSSYYKPEIDCISNSSQIFSAFEFSSFDEFEGTIENITSGITSAILSGNLLACVSRGGEIEPSGAVPFVTEPPE